MMKKPQPEGPPATPVRLLIAVGSASFLGMLVLMAPASLVPAIAGFDAAGVRFERIQGTLWRGDIRRVEMRGTDLGNIAYRIKPLALFSGRLGADVLATGGALAGEGSISLDAYGGAHIRDANLAFKLDTATRFAFLGEPLRGSLRADIRDIRFTRKGCAVADADVWTDVLTAPARRFDAGAMELAGAATCNGDNLVVAMTGTGEAGDVALTVEVTPSLTYLLAARAQPSRNEVRNALQSLGFQPDDGALTIGTRGAINSVGT